MSPKNTIVVLALGLGLAATPAYAQTAPPPSATSSNSVEARDEVLVLSPFEVTGDNVGYYAPNTLSGTRLNSELRDLGASISVITKQQMEDFAMLDANDLFLYELGTEGTGNYTEFAFDRNGYPLDSTSLEPGSSNRIRGVSSANTARGNFETSGRVPVDPINIDSVEISRGPNSSIFGLGNSGGTINVVPSSANLSRNRASTQFRADSYGGYRASVDLNRVLMKDKLAVRGSAVYQHDGFERKPSGTDSVRLNGMARYRPFKYTTVSASFESYRIHGRRPNTTLPRDTLTAWRNAGSPTWNPLTQRLNFNGVPSALTYTSSSSAANGVEQLGYFRIMPFSSTSLMLIEKDGSVPYWGQPAGTTNTNPGARNQNYFNVIPLSPVELVMGFSEPGLFNDLSLTDKGIYDWTSINIAAMNYLQESTNTAHLELEQFFLNTPRQILGLQVGFYREDSDKLRRDLAGGSTSTRSTGAIYVDVNEYLPDGSPNPNLMRPYIGLWTPRSYESPLLRESYRAQLAYRLDLEREGGALRWLGRHQLAGYAEYKNNEVKTISYKDAMTSDHSFIAPGTARGLTPGAIPNSHFRFYVGDNIGQNVDYAPASMVWGTYPYVWGNARTGAITTETATLGPAVSSASGNRQILKTRGLMLQSHLLNNRVVTTFGVRNDRNYNRLTKPIVFLPDGVNIDMDTFNQYRDGDWEFGEGPTKTAGIVVKPTQWLSLHMNKSDSFRPALAATNLMLEHVADPSGRGEDYGFSLNLYKGKLVTRVNYYTTTQIRARNGDSRTISNRARQIDFDKGGGSGTTFNLIPVATGWVERANPTWTQAQVAAEVARIVQLDPEYIAALPEEQLVETEDVSARGQELEIFYSPSDNWSVKFNLTRQESINSALSPGITNYLNARMPVWTSIIDPETGLNWWKSNYPTRSAETWFTGVVQPPMELAQAEQGKSRPQIRKYRANLLTSYRLSGLTDHRILKNFRVGGALRWEDKGAIGYYGLGDPITRLDRTRPIYDKAHLYPDAFVSYRARLFANKVSTTFQLNVRNLTEGGRLQPIRANPDGMPNTYRIIDPRQFILTSTFDF
jgi:outer membrane receptor protein involved in Fe transport